jgi:hypothetical protein
MKGKQRVAWMFEHAASWLQADKLAHFKPRLNTETLLPHLRHVQQTVDTAMNLLNGTRHIVVYYEDVVSDPKVSRPTFLFLFRRFASRSLSSLIMLMRAFPSLYFEVLSRLETLRLSSSSAYVRKEEMICKCRNHEQKETLSNLSIEPLSNFSVERTGVLSSNEKDSSSRIQEAASI